MKKLVFAIPVAIVGIFAVATVGASFYMLDYSLAPDSARRDTAFCFRELRRLHPEVTPWLDSLKAGHSLRDTFVVMPTGERHHAYYALNGSSHTAAIVIHGWRDCAIDFFYIGRLYHQQQGCHILMPDLHAHGLSEGDAVGMGWHERLDILHWMEIAHSQWGVDSIIVHGVSMGAATAMNVAGETMPSWLKSIRFIEDCGYTSVWDEFGYQLRQEFGLPAFPLLYTTSLLCKLKYGWSFGEASSLNKSSTALTPCSSSMATATTSSLPLWYTNSTASSPNPNACGLLREPNTLSPIPTIPKIMPDKSRIDATWETKKWIR